MKHAAHYTQPDTSDALIVNVAAFRQQIQSVEESCQRDYHACANATERASWAASTGRAAAELTRMTCKRATTQDMDRRERALDKSATLIIKVRGGK